MANLTSWITGIGQAATTVATVQSALRRPPKSPKAAKAPDEESLRLQRRRDLARRQLTTSRSSTLLSEGGERLGSGY